VHLDESVTPSPAPHAKSDFGSLRIWVDRIAIPDVFVASLGVAIAMAILRPIPHGHSYGLSIEVTTVLAVAWFVVRHRPHWVDEPRLLWPTFLIGLYFGVDRLLYIDAHSEIIAVYRDVFTTLSSGANPYDCSCITHFDEYRAHKLGNFNYPPAEIWPYWFAARLAGTWNAIVLRSTLCVLHALACILLWLTFRDTQPRTRIAFFPVLLFFELRTNVALTLLVVAALVFVMERRSRSEKPWHRPAIWVLFGVGLITKFLIIPMFAAYISSQLQFRQARRFGDSVVDALVPVLVAMAALTPFGVSQVFQETITFNLFLKTRAPLTTFYPNVLSGPMTWLGVPDVYPVFAVLFLGATVLAARWLRALDAMLCGSVAFLLVSATPEPQYVPVVIYLSAATLLSRRNSTNCTPNEPLEARAVVPRSTLELDVGCAEGR
jgi:hypothetical protein